MGLTASSKRKERAMSKQRANNEMSVYYDPSGKGSWKVAVTVPGSGGRRKVRRGSTRSEAFEKGMELLGQIRSGTLPTDERMTVKKWAEVWLEEKRLTVRESTVADYEMVVRLHINPSLGHLQLTRLTPAHIQGWYKSLLEKGLSANAVINYSRRLNSCLQRAVDLDYLHRNPVSKAKLPRHIKRPIRTLTVEEARKLQGAADGDRLEALLVLALSCGARQGELLALNWDDLDLEKGWIDIRRTLKKKPGGGFRFEQPKTESGLRRIRLTRQALEGLTRHRARQAAEAMRLGPAWKNKGRLIFVNEVGSPIHNANLTSRIFKRWLHAAKIPAGFRFHDLRHSCASLLLASGVPVAVVAEMLGHSSVAMTLSVYAHAIPNQQVMATDAMEGMLAG